jgi:ornithine cyclodeaminase/alanine dehydrogenase-like protein (mu-crystallin family)
MVDAVDILERAFRSDLPAVPSRSHYDANGGELLLMPAWGSIGLGVKLVTLEPSNDRRGLPFVQGVFVLFSADGMQPVATVDGTALTELRTAAVSALGARHLARSDAHKLLLFGAGRQAAAHIEALVAVRDLKQISIVDRNQQRARGLAERTAAELGIECRVGSTNDLPAADLICCCTTSREAVVRGDMVSDGAHITAMGAYRPDAREVDSATLRRARVIVESREAALQDAGDLILPIAAGEWDADQIDGELSDLVCGRLRPRRNEEITLFKTVGLASEDLVIAHAAVERAGYTALIRSIPPDAKAPE